MQDFLTINPIMHVDGTINLPGSKSISNRALLLAAQANGTTRLINLLDSDDMRHMLTAISKLGVNYYLSADRRSCEIYGLYDPLHADNVSILFLGNSGTSMRFLAAALCLHMHDIILTGNPRMKERPIGHLIDALRQGGAQTDCLQHEHYPPIRLRGGYQGGNITIDGSVSSQFLTALLMIAPLAPRKSCIWIKGQLVSRPCIDITITLIKSFVI